MEEEIELTAAQQLVFEVYTKGVQHEDCDLQEYVEKFEELIKE